MTRHYDWLTKFREFEENRYGPFKWGENDCCLYACDAIAAITGVDPAAKLRGYTTEAEANALIAQYGTLEDLAVAITTEYGMPELSPKKAQRGDVVLCRWMDKLSLCIIGTHGHPQGPSERGIVALPRGAMLRGWSVG